MASSCNEALQMRDFMPAEVGRGMYTEIFCYRDISSRRHLVLQSFDTHAQYCTSACLELVCVDARTRSYEFLMKSLKGVDIRSESTEYYTVSTAQMDAQIIT